MVLNYVSISAVSDLPQLDEVARICREEQFALPLAIGYQVSSKSINQGTHNSRQPIFRDLAQLDKATREYGFITAIHYYTKDNSTLLVDLERIAEQDIPLSETLLQLNTLPLSYEALSQIKEMGFKIIFKVAVSDKTTSQGGYSVWKGQSTQDVSSGQVEPLISQVYERKDLINYAMFDPSHGTNLDLVLSENSLAVRFGKAIAQNTELNQIGLVFAGGIKPSNVRPVLRSLISFFPQGVSIDSESGIRKDDRLDFGMVRDYLLGSMEELIKR